MVNKAIVIGGSNGIGLAISKELINKGFYPIILDRVTPEKNILPIDKFEYVYCNLLDFDDELFGNFANDPEVKVLIITAGIGRVANFEYLHITEIENLMEINSVASMKIINIFYDRIRSKESFYCGIMGSMAGLVSSPLFSVYGASKAAICSFIESINIELEMKNTNNRILNVSPIAIKGTQFNGGENELLLIKELATEIIERIFNNEILFIPQYDELCKGILESYKSNPHDYGIHSYNYKINSGRIVNEKKVEIGYLSGTFDLFHIGHLNLLKRAKKECDYLIVGVHPDASHKGKETFISFDERKMIVGACKYVDKVVTSCAEDCDAWELYKFDKLFVGSDYMGTERFNKYEKVLKEKGAEIIYFPYTVGTSSTQLREAINLK